MQATKGFPTHGHANMEIITYMVEGTLVHRDSTGSSSKLRPGDVQVMSAGSGITHSEFNASNDEELHLLQIWLVPEQHGVKPTYAEKHFPDESKRSAAMEPLTNAERAIGRQLFTSQAAPCLKCHMSGIPSRDATATAPNFLIARERLKPNWTFRWLLEPASIAPGTAMPSELFQQVDGRWVFNGEIPAAARDYAGDQAELLTRYMFQMDNAELRRLQALQ